MPPKRKPRTKTTQKQSQKQSVVVHIHATPKQNRKRRQTAAPQRRPASNSISFNPSLAVQMPAAYPNLPPMFSPHHELSRPNVLVPTTPAVASVPVTATARPISAPIATPIPRDTSVPVRIRRRVPLFHDTAIDTDAEVFKETKTFSAPKSYPDIQKSYEKNRTSEGKRANPVFGETIIFE